MCASAAAAVVLVYAKEDPRCPVLHNDPNSRIAFEIEKKRMVTQWQRHWMCAAHCKPPNRSPIGIMQYMMMDLKNPVTLSDVVNQFARAD